MEHIYIDKTIYTTRPVDNRLDKENRVYDLLEKLNIEFQRVDHDATSSISECEEVEALLNINICKNLFLCNSKKDEFYLLMMPGNKTFKSREVANQIGSTRLSFASDDYMKEFLNLTPGSVSILGLMNDKNNKVKALIDEELLKEEYLGFHPCINTSSLKIKTSDIFDKFLETINHKPTYLKI